LTTACILCLLASFTRSFNVIVILSHFSKTNIQKTTFYFENK